MIQVLMSNIKVLLFAGSLRTGSYNKKLARIAGDIAEEKGASATFIDLKDYPLPIYDQDIEDSEALPENADKLKKLFDSHDAFIISSPEYNSGYSGALKNTIDWISRKQEGEKPLQQFKGKVAALLSASPGRLGGLRGLFQLRMLLNNLHILILPQMFSLSGADESFTDSDKLKSEKDRAKVEAIVEQLIDITRKLKS